MKPLEKHNMGRGDYWVYRSDARTKDALIEDVTQLLEQADLSFPLFVLTSPPGFPISLEFRNRDEIRNFCQGYAFAVK